MARTAIDWEYWRHKYVSGDDSVTLEHLSNIPNAPSLVALKRHCAKGSWSEQRKAYRYQTIAKVADSATTQAAIAQTQQLIDAAEVITRHLQMAKALHSLAARRLRDFRPEELNAKDLVSWVNAATNIERLAMGLSTDRKEVNVSIDLATLSDEELEAIASGVEPGNILN